MRDITYAVYALIALVALVLEVAGFRLLPVLRSLTRPWPGRVLLLLGWAWLGWHLFVRGSASFLR
jgi:Family of unknown function (DUF6186)